MIYGIGIDVVEIERIRRTLSRTGERFIERVFTKEEQQYCRGRPRSEACYAARFAAKEAFLKAFGTGSSGPAHWLDIEVRPDVSGKPGLHAHGRLQQRCMEMGIQHMHLSLSHGASMAIAQVVLEC
jgi:holo-[acyl-carrier protein] synthase